MSLHTITFPPLKRSNNIVIEIAYDRRRLVFRRSYSAVIIRPLSFDFRLRRRSGRRERTPYTYILCVAGVTFRQTRTCLVSPSETFVKRCDRRRVSVG
jgi:hypothetical protein